MSTISASTTTTTAYKVTADTTGTLVFQTGATPTTAMTIDASQGVTFASQPTYSGGTANGVLYLNGSKVVTTGSALTFDGARLGIGVASPTRVLDVSAATAISFLTSSTGTNTSYYAVSNTGGGFYFGRENSAGTTFGTAVAYASAVWSEGAYPMVFATNNTERARIDSSGNLGVGTTSPSYKLTVQDTGNAYIVLQSGTAGYANLRFIVTSSAGILGTEGAFPLVFRTSDAERARIDSSGNFLVGGTFGAGFQVYFANTDGVNSRSGQAAGSSRSLYTGWYSATSTTQGTLSFNVTTNGNVTNTNNSYGAISDIKLKENIVDATPKLEKLCQVRVVNYNFKEGQTHKQIGVIAQELEQVFPSMIEEVPDRDAEGNDIGTTTKQVKYSVFVPMLIKAIQEQQALIQQLQADVAALKGAA